MQIDTTDNQKQDTEGQVTEKKEEILTFAERLKKTFSKKKREKVTDAQIMEKARYEVEVAGIKYAIRN